MSPLDPEIPPAGEEIHLPGGSIQPLLVALGVTITLIGVTFSIYVTIFGLVLTTWTIVRWVMDSNRDIEELPLHHDTH